MDPENRDQTETVERTKKGPAASKGATKDVAVKAKSKKEQPTTGQVERAKPAKPAGQIKLADVKTAVPTKKERQAVAQQLAAERTPAEQKRQLYEGMYILHATLSQEAREKALSRIQEGIVNRGGEIVKVHDMGRRKLAYTVSGRREGNYYVIYFSAPCTAVKELWQEYHHNEDLMRFITLKAEKVLESLEFPVIIQED